MEMTGDDAGEVFGVNRDRSPVGVSTSNRGLRSPPDLGTPHEESASIAVKGLIEEMTQPEDLPSLEKLLPPVTSGVSDDVGVRLMERSSSGNPMVLSHTLLTEGLPATTTTCSSLTMGVPPCCPDLGMVGEDGFSAIEETEGLEVGDWLVPMDSSSVEVGPGSELTSACSGSSIGDGMVAPVTLLESPVVVESVQCDVAVERESGQLLGSLPVTAVIPGNSDDGLPAAFPVSSSMSAHCDDDHYVVLPSTLSGADLVLAEDGTVREEVVDTSVTRAALRLQPTDGLRQLPRPPSEPLPVRVEEDSGRGGVGGAPRVAPDGQPPLAQPGAAEFVSAGDSRIPISTGDSRTPSG
ncbi:hypothetical protein Dimus_022225 [Dionaea muscipula]